MIKSLLDIGKEKGNILSPNEVKDFFQATYEGFDKTAQNRVLRFMKALKEGQMPAKKNVFGCVVRQQEFC